MPKVSPSAPLSAEHPNDAPDQAILAAAEGILREKLQRQGCIGNPMDAADFLRMRMGALPHEEFHVLWLDNRHHILDCQRLFTGTVDGVSVHPREVVRAALGINASAAILAPNHPSGVAEPGAADRAITNELRDALRLVLYAKVAAQSPPRTMLSSVISSRLRHVLLGADLGGFQKVRAFWRNARHQGIYEACGLDEEEGQLDQGCPEGDAPRDD